MLQLEKVIERWVKPQLAFPLVLLSLAAGCAVKIQHFTESSTSQFQSTIGNIAPEEHKMTFRYQVRDGEAALENERVVLVFHGLSSEEQRVFHFQGGQTVVQVKGAGQSMISTTCSKNWHKVVFRSEYANGTNTLQFGEQTVVLTNGGELLSMGDQSVDLSGSLKVVHVKGKKLTVE